jgi:hypothetical protein
MWTPARQAGSLPQTRAADPELPSSRQVPRGIAVTLTACGEPLRDQATEVTPMPRGHRTRRMLRMRGAVETAPRLGKSRPGDPASEPGATGPLYTGLEHSPAVGAGATTTAVPWPRAARRGEEPQACEGVAVPGALDAEVGARVPGEDRGDHRGARVHVLPCRHPAAGRRLCVGWCPAIGECLGGNPFRFLTLEDMWGVVLRTVTTTPAASRDGTPGAVA